MRKDLSCPRVVNGTLSTAGRGTVLTADEVTAAISEGAAAREADKLAKSHAKRAREAKATEKKSLESIAARARRAKLQEKQDKFLRKTWDEISSDAANDGACRLRAMGLLASTAAKLRRRALASRARRGAPPQLSPYELWRVVSAEAAGVGKQQLRRVTHLRGKRGARRAIRQTLLTVISLGAAGGYHCGGGGRARACRKIVYACVAVALGGAALWPVVLSGVRPPRCLSMICRALCLLRRRRWASSKCVACMVPGGRGEGGGLFGKPCSPSLHKEQEGVVFVAGGWGARAGRQTVYACVALLLGGASLWPVVVSGVRPPRCLSMSCRALCLLRRPR